MASRGRLEVNAGAARALSHDGRSLLRVGVESHAGVFVEGDAVDIVSNGVVLAKGLVRSSAERFDDGDEVAVHRDDLVLFAE